MGMLGTVMNCAGARRRRSAQAERRHGRAFGNRPCRRLCESLPAARDALPPRRWAAWCIFARRHRQSVLHDRLRRSASSRRDGRRKRSSRRTQVDGVYSADPEEGSVCHALRPADAPGGASPRALHGDGRRRLSPSRARIQFRSSSSRSTSQGGLCCNLARDGGLNDRRTVTSSMRDGACEAGASSTEQEY